MVVLDTSHNDINIDGQKLHKNKPFIARKVANKITQSKLQKKLQINKPLSLNSEILFNQNFSPGLGAIMQMLIFLFSNFLFFLFS